MARKATTKKKAKAKTNGTHPPAAAAETPAAEKTAQPETQAGETPTTHNMTDEQQDDQLRYRLANLDSVDSDIVVTQEEFNTKMKALKKRRDDEYRLIKVEFGMLRTDVEFDRRMVKLKKVERDRAMATQARIFKALGLVDNLFDWAATAKQMQEEAKAPAPDPDAHAAGDKDPRPPFLRNRADENAAAVAEAEEVAAEDLI